VGGSAHIGGGSRVEGGMKVGVQEKWARRCLSFWREYVVGTRSSPSLNKTKKKRGLPGEKKKMANFDYIPKKKHYMIAEKAFRREVCIRCNIRVKEKAIERKITCHARKERE